MYEFIIDVYGNLVIGITEFLRYSLPSENDIRAINYCLQKNIFSELLILVYQKPQVNQLILLGDFNQRFGNEVKSIKHRTDICSYTKNTGPNTKLKIKN